MKIVEGKSQKSPFALGIVASRFNSEITERLVTGAKERLKEINHPSDDVTLVWVPGAVELPLAAQRLAQLGTFDAIICLGAVIKGETDHYEYVCRLAADGCQHVAMQNDLPVIFGVLTTQTDEQAIERAGGKHGNKGKEAVDAAVEMVSVLRQLG